MAEPCGDDYVGAAAQLSPGGAAAFLGARDKAACGDDERGDVFGYFAGNLRQDR
jgi:hypothetical protein